MYRTDTILETLRMFQDEMLDVRTVTLGLNLEDCASAQLPHMLERIHAKILRYAGDLSRQAGQLENRYGVKIVNRRISITPIASVAAGHNRDALVKVAETLDKAATEVSVDLLGGYSALVHKGGSRTAGELIESLPEALSSTSRVCASVNAASSRAGINMDAILRLGHIIGETAHRDAANSGFAAAKLVVFANAAEDNPFMAGAMHGHGEPEAVINVGVSGPGVVKRALERLIARAEAEGRTLTLADYAEEIKITAFRVTRVGELIGRELAEAMGLQFGIVDLSLAPTPAVGDSIGEILQVMGFDRIGAPGTTAAIAMLNDAVKKGGAFASSRVGGLSGAFVPVMEDSTLAEAVAAGHLNIEKLEAITSVCSVGLDMTPIPGDTPAETIAGIMADEMAIGAINNKTTATRLIPVPGKKAGDFVSFGGLFGACTIMDVVNAGGSDRFVQRAGHIPAALHSLKN